MLSSMIMKYFRRNIFLAALPALFLLIASGAATAQVMPATKVAVITSMQFSEKTGGITKLNNAFTSVETEFRPRATELDNIAAQINRLKKEVDDGAKVPAANQAALRQKADQVDQLTRDYKRKSEDANLAFEKRLETLTAPIWADLEKSMIAYAKKRGIDILIDRSKTQGVFVFNDAVDITAAFIAEYNAKPATP